MEGSRSHVVSVDGVVTLIENELEGVHSISNNCCIYRVPYRFKSGQFREVKEEAYTPKVVSIGPLHYGNESLQNMEEKKKIYLTDFLQRNNVRLEQCVETVKEGLERLRSCYEENLGYIKDDELMKIIVVDAVFVIETSLKCSYPKFRNPNDRMFSPLFLPDVGTEFLLLENQLPFFILEDLFQFERSIDKTLIECCYHIFEENEESIKNLHMVYKEYKPKHLVDLMWISYGPSKRSHGGQHETCVNIPQQGDQEFARIRNATQLHQAGVKLDVRKSTSNSFDICFNKGTGTLEIPKLQVSDRTDSELRNLIAFEQCHNCRSNYLSDYIALLDEIVNTPKDVDLLVEKKIIVNLLGQSEDVSNIINRLGDGVTFADGNNFSYDQLRFDVNNYCETQWHKWEANLKQNYFNTPWAIISFLAAFVLIVLTIIQTGSLRLSFTKSDRIFNRPWMLWDIVPDLLLLENQVPFFIIEDLFDLYKTSVTSGYSERLSIVKIFSELVYKSLANLVVTEDKLQKICRANIEHFVHLLLCLYIPLDAQPGGTLRTVNSPSMTQLYRAGVKFKVESSVNLFDIHFAKGVLKIPKLTVEAMTQTVIRNILAFEQCHFLHGCLGDYVVFIQRLINTPKDVDLLVANGIVESTLADSSEVSAIINKLAEGIFVNSDDFYFASICEDLNVYCRTSWHKWMANLKQNYFNTPWAIISVIATIFLIVLTIIQAVCSIISVIN